MAKPIESSDNAYRGDTLVLNAPYPSIAFTTVRAQIRTDEDATTYIEPVTIVQDSTTSQAVCTFDAATTSQLDADVQYVFDVQFENAAGFVVTTQKWTLTIIRDVTRVTGTLFVATTDVANVAALPAIGSAVVGRIYKALAEGTLHVKPNSSSTSYSAFY